jgi:hypothetical protein
LKTLLLVWGEKGLARRENRKWSTTRPAAPRLDDAFESFEDSLASLLLVQEVRPIALDDLDGFIVKRGVSRQDDDGEIHESLVEPNELQDLESRPVAIEVDVQDHRIDARARGVQTLQRHIRVAGVQHLIAVANEEL